MWYFKTQFELTAAILPEVEIAPTVRLDWRKAFLSIVLETRRASKMPAKLQIWGKLGRMMDRKSLLGEEALRSKSEVDLRRSTQRRLA